MLNWHNTNIYLRSLRLSRLLRLLHCLLLLAAANENRMETCVCGKCSACSLSFSLKFTSARFDRQLPSGGTVQAPVPLEYNQNHFGGLALVIYHRINTKALCLQG